MTTEHISPRSAFGIRFSLLARRWRRQIETELADMGLTDATWAPMIHLRETGGGITQKELAELVGVGGPSLVRVLDILERGKLIERRRDVADGRARRIFLTPEGERRVAQISLHLAKAEEAILVDLTDADLAVILKYFEVIDRRMTRLGECRRRTVGE